VGVEMDRAAPVAAGWFIEPAVFEELFQQQSGFLAGGGGGGRRGLAVGLELEAGMGFEGLGDQGDDFLAGHAVGAVGRLGLEGV